jgi:ankyrin repeat protein
VLHVIANRNQYELAAYLIEKGINTMIKNHQKLCALDLCKSKEMREVMGYRPSSWSTYENYVLRKNKFFGLTKYYVILKKGSIIYYETE